MADRARQLRREMTPQERILWNALRRNQLDGFHFRRQQVIDGYIVDFYCHSASVVVEVDGSVHDHQQEYDEARDDQLARRGLLILRVRNEEIERNLAGVLDRIRKVCRDHLTPRPPSLRGKGELGVR